MSHNSDVVIAKHRLSLSQRLIKATDQKGGDEAIFSLLNTDNFEIASLVRGASIGEDSPAMMLLTYAATP